MSSLRAKISQRLKKKLKLLLSLIVFVEVVLIVLFMLPLLLNTPVAIIRINSDSMLPEYEDGDFVIINGRNKDDSLLGGVIAYYNPIEGNIIIHRAVAEADECYITKGDNNSEEDFFIPCGRYILGKVIYKL